MRRDLRNMLILAVLALLIGGWMAAQLRHPGYTDAYYYFNGGQRLATGHGLTEVTLWTYLGAASLPPGLPVPSHLYWMPLPSLVAALGMILPGAGGATFDAAQIGFVLLYAGIVATGYGIGVMLGGNRRIGWMAGLLTLFSGVYMPYWVTTASFGPFGLAGAGCLLTLGIGHRAAHLTHPAYPAEGTRRLAAWRWFALAGALAGLAHLARNDGLLLVLVGVLVVLFGKQRRSANAAALVAGYLLVMAPWFLRNLVEIGAALPAGGLDTAFMRTYEEITRWPPGASLGDFLNWGPENILASRGDAFVVNLQRFVAEQGMIVLTPLMLIALWRRRRDPLLSAVILYGIGLHLAMTLVFALPGARGGLFHSSAVLVPWWAALGVLGLDDVIEWVARRRRRWKAGEARVFFSAALMLYAVWWSLHGIMGKFDSWNHAAAYFEPLTRELPPDAVVMINDPPALYYFTGNGGVVLPDSPPDVILDLAGRYGVTFVVVDANRTLPMDGLYAGQNIPLFLEPVWADDTFRIYRVRTDER